MNGELSLAARIVSYAYLWNIIRVQGGAYGTGLTAGVSGLTACYSYRDPKGAESLQKYETVGTFLKEFTDAIRTLPDSSSGRCPSPLAY